MVLFFLSYFQYVNLYINQTWKKTAELRAAVRKTKRDLTEVSSLTSCSWLDAGRGRGDVCMYTHTSSSLLTVTLDALEPLFEVIEVGGGRGGAAWAVWARLLLLQLRLTRLLQLWQLTVKHVSGGGQGRPGQQRGQRTLVFLLLLLLLLLLLRMKWELDSNFSGGL